MVIVKKVVEQDKGLYGEFGGSYIPEELKAVLNNISNEFFKALNDQNFLKDLDYYLKNYAGRETPLYYAKNMTKDLGGAKIYLKREDLNHTGAHKINNTIGQALLAKRMGLKRIIAETGAGQHGVATATAAALFGLECIIYMGLDDALKQPLNVQRMELLGAHVHLVESGNKDLKAAVDAALLDLVENSTTTFYILGSAVGPFPYPGMVKYFQSVIGDEIREQLQLAEHKLPDYVLACVGGGSNAIGAFSAFIGNKKTKLVGIEPAGIGLDTKLHAAPMNRGTKGIIHGYKTYIMQDSKGEIEDSHSIASGLNYPGVGPEHSYLHDAGLATYVGITDFEAVDAFRYLSKMEGIIPAIESAHAVAYAIKLAPTLKSKEIIVINISGRGDKDMDTILTSEQYSLKLRESLEK